MLRTRCSWKVNFPAGQADATPAVNLRPQMQSIEQLLEASRRELLDLSTRNRLLSMPVGSKSAKVIHVKDEISDHIFRMLVGERKAFGFLPGIENKKSNNSGEIDDELSMEFEEEAGLPQPEERG